MLATSKQVIDESFLSVKQQENVVKLNAHKDFIDVTLVSDDYKILTANRVILSRKDLECKNLT